MLLLPQCLATKGRSVKLEELKPVTQQRYVSSAGIQLLEEADFGQAPSLHESAHSLAATQKMKYSCSNQNPKEERKIPEQGNIRKLDSIGARETLGVHHF